MNNADRRDLEFIEKRMDDAIEALVAKVEALDRLTETKFVTHKTMLDSQAAQVSLALAAAEKAITKAETAVEKRLEAMDEFRGAVTDLTAKNVSRAEHLATVAALTERIEALREDASGGMSRLDRLEGRIAGYSGAAAAAGVITAIAIQFIR